MSDIRFLRLLSNLCVCVLIGLLFVGCASSKSSRGVMVSDEMTGQDVEIPIYDPIPDPLEPLNRSISVFNHIVMVGVVTPSSYVYRLVLPTPVRNCIRRAGHNINYPVRFANNLLQLKFRGVGDETTRFLVNSTIGVAGLFDPATPMGIGRSDEDLGQTLGHWGWSPKLFLMLPVLGPSNERDLLGRVGDAFASPPTYFFPAAPALAYNDMVYKVDPYHNFVATNPDPYNLLRLYVSLERQESVLDSPFVTAPDDEAIQTLASVFYLKEDGFAFVKRSRTDTVVSESSGRAIPFSYWLQPNSAPIVYLIPGLGSHRLSQGNVAIARVLFDAGFSVLTISNVMHPEFMAKGSSMKYPGLAETDVQDVQRALTAIRAEMKERHPQRIEREALMGISLGGFLTTIIAASDGATPAEERFDRYVAVNTPVSLYRGIVRLDDYFKAPLRWQKEERNEHIEKTLKKMAQLDLVQFESEDGLPFDPVEARFLIGFGFRLKLRDVIYASERQGRSGLLKAKPSWISRDEVYSEIMDYSYYDYFEKLLIPYSERRNSSWTRDRVLEVSDLRSHRASIATQRELRVINNRNDFLVSDEDNDWLRSVLDPSRLVLFDFGGHMGNLHLPKVQSFMIEAVQDLLE